MDVGVYTITTTATLQMEPYNNLNPSQSYSFTLTVLHDCVNTVLTDKTIISMTTQVSQAAVTQEMSIIDSIATIRGT